MLVLCLPPYNLFLPLHHQYCRPYHPRHSHHHPSCLMKHQNTHHNSQISHIGVWQKLSVLDMLVVLRVLYHTIQMVFGSFGPGMGSRYRYVVGLFGETLLAWERFVM